MKFNIIYKLQAEKPDLKNCYFVDGSSIKHFRKKNWSINTSWLWKGL